MNTALFVSALAIMVAASHAGYGYRGGALDRDGTERLGAVCRGPCSKSNRGLDCIKNCPNWGVCITNVFREECCCFPDPEGYPKCNVLADCKDKQLFCDHNLALECDYVKDYKSFVCACVGDNESGDIEVTRPLSPTKSRRG